MDVDEILEKIVERLKEYNHEADQTEKIKMEMIFWEIVEQWKSMNDIKYDIPISSMLEMMKEAPRILEAFCENKPGIYIIKQFNRAESHSISRLL